MRGQADWLRDWLPGWEQPATLNIALPGPALPCPELNDPACGVSHKPCGCSMNASRDWLWSVLQEVLDVAHLLIAGTVGVKQPHLGGVLKAEGLLEGLEVLSSSRWRASWLAAARRRTAHTALATSSMAAPHTAVVTPAGAIHLWVGVTGCYLVWLGPMTCRESEGTY